MAGNLPPAGGFEPQREPSRLVELVRAQVTVNGETDWRGELALVLAEAMAPRDSGTGKAALARQLQEVLAAVAENGPRVASPLDDLRARRAARLQELQG